MELEKDNRLIILDDEIIRCHGLLKTKVNRMPTNKVSVSNHHNVATIVFFSMFFRVYTSVASEILVEELNIL